MLFGCPEGIKIIIFKGPHVRLVSDRQTTNFLLKNGPQNRPQNHWIWVSIFTTFLGSHLDTYFNDFVSQMLPKQYPKTVFFETSDLAKV